MSNKVRCQRCRGQKKYAGIGGVMKDCETCDSTGYIERELKAVPAAIEVETVHFGVLEDVPDVMLVPYIEDEIEVSAPAPAVQVGTILPGYDDEFMRAILAEPTMDAIAWAAAYKHVGQLFGINPMTQKWDELLTKVQRASIREMYAYSKPIKDRQVDLNVSQDAAVNSDPEYKQYVASEKKRLSKADAGKKTGKGKSKMGGV